MSRGRPEQPASPWQETPARATEQSTAEEAVLRIDELEARLTPDGPFGSPPNNNPPSGQVGWGC
jgi:hypothetical protein